MASYGLYGDEATCTVDARSHTVELYSLCTLSIIAPFSSIVLITPFNLYTTWVHCFPWPAAQDGFWSSVATSYSESPLSCKPMLIPLAYFSFFTLPTASYSQVASLPPFICGHLYTSKSDLHSSCRPTPIPLASLCLHSEFLSNHESKHSRESSRN